MRLERPAWERIREPGKRFLTPFPGDTFSRAPFPGTDTFSSFSPPSVGSEVPLSLPAVRPYRPAHLGRLFSSAWDRFFSSRALVFTRSYHVETLKIPSVAEIAKNIAYTKRP